MSKTNIILRIMPFGDWVVKLSPQTFRADFIAGLTGAVIGLPQGIAFALIAGLPPEYGLYTAIITQVIASLFGSSHHLISGPTTPISIVVFAAISKFAEPFSPDFISLVISLTLMVGLIQFVLGLVRMGALVNFVSHTVIVGFTAGASILIITSQLKHVLGVSITRQSSFIANWQALFEAIPQTNLYALLIAGITLGVGIIVRRIHKKLPYLLIAMLIGTLLSIFLKGDLHGVKLVGEVPAQLPPFGLPNMDLDLFRMLAPDAFALALLGLIEAVSIARALASQSHQQLNGNQEFIGQGLSNIVGAFFSCYPGSGSFTRSALNFYSGAKTPIAAFFAAGFLVIMLLWVAPWLSYLPMPAMGGIILLVAVRLIDVPQIKAIFKTSRNESAVLAVTFLATLFLDLQFAIYMGVLLSLVFYLQQTSHPRVISMAPHPRRERRRFSNIIPHALKECPQLKIIRIDGSLFFGALDHLSNELPKILKDPSPTPRYLLIIANGINFIDYAGVTWLELELKKWEQAGIQTYFSGLKGPAYRFLEKSGYIERIGPERFFRSKKEAIVALFEQMDQEQCQRCTARIFQECEEVPTLALSDS